MKTDKGCESFVKAYRKFKEPNGSADIMGSPQILAGKINDDYLGCLITVKTRDGRTMTDRIEGYEIHHSYNADPDNPDLISIHYDMETFGCIDIPVDALISM